MMHTWAHSVCQPDYNSMCNLAFQQQQQQKAHRKWPGTADCYSSHSIGGGGERKRLKNSDYTIQHWNWHLTSSIIMVAHSSGSISCLLQNASLNFVCLRKSVVIKCELVSLKLIKWRMPSRVIIDSNYKMFVLKTKISINFALWKSQLTSKKRTNKLFNWLRISTSFSWLQCLQFWIEDWNYVRVGMSQIIQHELLSKPFRLWTNVFTIAPHDGKQ